MKEHAARLSSSSSELIMAREALRRELALKLERVRRSARRHSLAMSSNRAARPRAKGPSPWLVSSQTSKPEQTFDSFVSDGANRLALRLAWGIADATLIRPDQSPLLVVGPEGSGKTHLLSAAVSWVSDIEAGESLMLNLFDLELEVEQAERFDRLPELRRWLHGHRLVAIDDIHELRWCSPRLLEELRALVGAVAVGSLGLILAKDERRACHELLEQVLLGAQRVEIAVGGKGHRGRIAASMATPPFPDMVLDYLATRSNGNARHMREAITQLQATRRLLRREVTLDDARAVFPPKELMTEKEVPEDLGP